MTMATDIQKWMDRLIAPGLSDEDRIVSTREMMVRKLKEIEERERTGVDVPAPSTPTACPACASGNIASINVDEDEREVIQKWVCEECDCQWEAHFVYHAFRVTYPQEQDAVVAE